MEDGFLELHQYYEHMAKLAGRWAPFVCTADEDRKQACPICEMPGHYNSLVGIFTIIDHRTIKGRDGTIYKNTVKLFVAKSNTLDQLTRLGQTRKGLAGCTFQVSRSTNKKAARVGDVFDFLGKKSLGYIKKRFKADVIDYSSAIIYRTPDQLRELGFGVDDQASDYDDDYADYEEYEEYEEEAEPDEEYEDYEEEPESAEVDEFEEESDDYLDDEPEAEAEEEYFEEEEETKPPPRRRRRKKVSSKKKSSSKKRATKKKATGKRRAKVVRKKRTRPAEDESDYFADD